MMQIAKPSMLQMTHYIKPRRPQQNARAERRHRTILFKNLSRYLREDQVLFNFIRDDFKYFYFNNNIDTYL